MTAEGEAWAEGTSVLLGAVPEEIAGLRALLIEEDRHVGPRGMKLRRGTILGHPVALLATGEGSQRAHRAMEWLDEILPEAPILFLGVAGGLSAALAPGDLVVGEMALEFGGDATFESFDLASRETAAALGLGVRNHAADALASDSGLAAPVGPAVLVTVDWIVTDSVEKTRLWQRVRRSLEETGTEAGGEPYCTVDMESAAVARCAAESSRRLLIVRAVSDSAAESLPSFLNRTRRADGSISRWRVAGYMLLLWPWTLFRVLHLRQRMRLCSRRLTEFGVSWLQHRAKSSRGGL